MSSSLPAYSSDWNEKLNTDSLGSFEVIVGDIGDSTVWKTGNAVIRDWAEWHATLENHIKTLTSPLIDVFDLSLHFLCSHLLNPNFQYNKVAITSTSITDTVNWTSLVGYYCLLIKSLLWGHLCVTSIKDDGSHCNQDNISTCLHLSLKQIKIDMLGSLPHLYVGIFSDTCQIM